MEDQLELQCPHCQSLLTIDDAGDLELLELPELAANQTRGLGGLTVEHVNHDHRAQYLANQQGQIPETQKHAFDFPKMKRAQKDSAPAIGKTTPEADAAVLESNKKDLNKRNIK